MHVIWADIISQFEDVFSNNKNSSFLKLKKGESARTISFSKKNDKSENNNNPG